MKKNQMRKLLAGCGWLLWGLGILPAQDGVVGELRDSLSGAALPYVTVHLLAGEEAGPPAAGALSDSLGRFELKAPQPGRYRLRFSSLGYQPRETAPFILARLPRGTLLDLGRIRLPSATLELEEVEISAERSFMQSTPEKKSYDVGQMVNTRGGTALDILSNLPSVAVDIDGNVSLRGSQNVNILINGKPSTLSGANLEQLQAAAVESVEVITNPSADYDPDGAAGLINIVLKKNRRDGLGGNVALSAGSRHKYNTTAALYQNRGRWNLTGSYGIRYDNRYQEREGLRSVLGGSGLAEISQLTLGGFQGLNHLAQASAEYALHPRHSFSARSLYNYGYRDRFDSTLYTTLDPAPLFAEQFQRSSDEYEPETNIEAGFGYRASFPQPGRSLVFDALHSRNQEYEDDRLRDIFFLADGSRSGRPAAFQRIYNPSLDLNTTFQLDYAHPLAGGAVLEAGAKSILRKNDNDIQSSRLDSLTRRWESDLLLSNRFVYRDQIHALYGSYAGERKKFSYKAGLRAEYAALHGDLLTTGETVENTFLNLFPSAFLNYAFSDEQQLTLTYSRRINRPRVRDLNPFQDVSDPLTLRAGNPNLQPEYIHSAELGHTLSASSASLSSTLYFRQTVNAFNRIVEVDSLGRGVVRVDNFGTNRSYGLDVSLNGNPAKWFSYLLNVNAFRNDIDASAVDAALSSGAWVANTRLNLTFRTGKGPDVQLTGVYNSPRNTAQGQSLAFYALDFSLRQKLWKGAGNLAFALTDVFDTQRFGFSAAGEGFTQDFVFKRETRIATLSFSWRFGKEQEQRRRQGRDENRGGGDMGDF